MLAHYRTIGLALMLLALAKASPMQRPGSIGQLKDRISSGFDLSYAKQNHGSVALHQQPNLKMDPVTTCYGSLGCLVTDDSWYDPVNRPFNADPMSREDINTRFIMHTRERPTQDTMLYADDPDSIKYSTFNPNRPTQILVHGFVDDGTVKWMKRLTANLLDYGDYNVIITNWGDGSLPLGYPLYTQATANTRVVGLEIAHLVNTMIDLFGAKAKDFHLIGHSLGAHTVGYAGERIAGLGRITGLDPAEPYFQYMPENVRLDPTDANFVDAIHTDGKTILLLGYGMMQPVGNLDFYVNGGRDQPGCDPVNIGLDAITEDMVTGGRELAACNHLRSIEFFIDSLVPSNQAYQGYECLDYETFLTGVCNSCGADNVNCARFGMESIQFPDHSKLLVPLYFQTGKDVPYLKYHYSIKLSLANPNEAEKFVWGKLQLSLYGTKTQLVLIDITPDGSIKMFHGEDTMILNIQDEDVGKIQRVELHWNYDGTVLELGSLCGLLCNDHLYVNNIEISEMNNYPESARLEHTYKSCPLDASYAEIKDRNTAEFYPTACA